MSTKTLCSLWGVMFIICAALGFIPEPAGGMRAVFTCLSVLFFLPPAMLLLRSGKTGDRGTLKLIRNLALASLVLTLALLIGNLISAMGSEFLGDMLYGMLILVSCPMVCGGYWALSLFLWACLLMGSLGLLRKTRQ